MPVKIYRSWNGPRQHSALRKWLLTLGWALLASVLVTPVHADIVLEHVDGLPGTFMDPALSGDGEWMVWKVSTNPPLIGIKNLNDDSLVLHNLRTSTGDTGLSFTQTRNIAINGDGSRIAITMAGDGQGKVNIVMVVDGDGVEVARLTLLSDGAITANMANEIEIDKSGRYVVFSAGLGFFPTATLTSLIAGGGGETLITTEFARDAFRFDTVDGSIDRVSGSDIEGSLGDELNNHVTVMGISDGGRYALFSTNASNISGANGRHQVFIRDMNSDYMVEHISLEPDGTIFGAAAWAWMSDNGDRALLYIDGFWSVDGLNHTYLWQRGKGTKDLPEIQGPYIFYRRHLSGDGRWVASGRDALSRLNVDTGSIYTFTGADDQDQTLIDNPIQSSNGELLLFSNSTLARPPGEDGIWWTLRYDALPPLEALVTETITVNEDVFVLAPITIAIDETIYITDAPQVLPALTIAIAETITVADSVLAEPFIDPADRITIIPMPAPIRQGWTFAAEAGGFKPLTQVQAFLLSDPPLLVGEESADANGDAIFMIVVPIDFPTGEHTVILLGQEPDGSERRLTALITVELRDSIFKDSFESQ